MNMIPYFKFLGAILFAGAMLYVFFPLMDTLISYFPEYATGNGWIIIFAIWNGLPLIVLVKETIQILMSMQRRTI